MSHTTISFRNGFAPRLRDGGIAVAQSHCAYCLVAVE